jgi:hypothetical protein
LQTVQMRVEGYELQEERVFGVLNS